LPQRYARQGWKLKIRDRERTEAPHVTVLFRTKAWRFGLRELRFLDREPPPREIPEAILDCIADQFLDLVGAWDEIYPFNKVASEDEEDASVDGILTFRAISVAAARTRESCERRGAA
jgi:hypothetical protein